MWALLSARVRRWVLLALGLPLLGWLLGRLGAALEARRGETALSRGLRGAGDWLRRRARRPLRRFGSARGRGSGQIDRAPRRP